MHGLQARTSRLAWESEDDYNAFIAAVKEELDPVGIIEEMCVDAIITAQWRLMRLSLIENGTLYRAAANVMEMQQIKMPDTGTAPMSDQCAMTTQELRQRHESVVAGAVAYDLSEGATLVHLDRFRRSCERTISENLDRLQAWQQNRLAQDEEFADDGDGDGDRA
jgi:hypothetical protein